MHNVVIPALGESITEGVISKWLVADGASVGESTPILELETDKITTEIQAGVSGILRRKAAEGAAIKVGAVAAVIEPGAAPAAAAAAPSTAPAARSGTQPGPAAQKLLAESGLDPASVKGSGKDGRVTKGDVLATSTGQPAAVSAPRPAATAPVAAAPAAAATPPAAAAAGGMTRKRMSPIRQRIAQRLVQAQRTAAILTTFNEVDMSAAMGLRKKWKETFEKQHGTGLGFMSIFATAVVHALKKYPLVNSQIDGTDVLTPDGVHLSIAIGTEKGLVVPVLRNAQDMGFADIEKAIKGYAGKAKDGKLTLDDMNGGTFTITNGGVYGSLMSTPILNPPQSGILGMHTIKDRPIAVDGQVVIRPMMYIALSYDHRIVDGAEAVGFLVRVKELVEAPERMLLGVTMTYDLIIIGAGPGGYVCAIRAAQLGKKVAIVEKRAADGKTRLGGTCLNVGCIPSKALLDTSEKFYEAKKHFAEHGIAVQPTIDVAQMLKRKTTVVDTLVGGIAGLMRKHKIEVLSGRGELLGPGKVRVTAADGSTTDHTSQHVVLAMGSVPIELPFLKYDGSHIVSSDQAISFPAIPKRLVVVGGGVIGLELGSVWSRLGSDVTVVEALPQLCPFLDADVAKALQKVLEKQGLKFVFEAKVTGAARAGDEVTLTGTAKDGSPLSWTADRVLVAVGRRPCIEAAGLEAAGIALTERKRVRIDGSFRTSLPGVWAIGDLVDGPMLAHKAEEEGVAVAELIAGQHGHVDHNLIPNVVYTEPEVASIGLNEAECGRRGLVVRVGKFPFLANGRARAAGATDGFVKIIADAKTDRVLGAAVIGPRAADLISSIAAHMVYGGSSEDIARTCVAHPTVSEAVKEAALDTLGRVIHA